MLLRLGTVLMTLALALAVTAFAANAIYGEPGEPSGEITPGEQGTDSVGETVAPKKIVENSKLPDIESESADLPEVVKKEEPAPEAPPPQPEPRKKQPPLKPEKPPKDEPPKAEPSTNAERAAPEPQGSARPQKKELRSLPSEASRNKTPDRESKRPEKSKAGADGQQKSSDTKSSGTKSSGTKPSGMRMSLSVERIGVRGESIRSTSSEKALDEGLTHLPQTSLPWDRGKSRNVYVVGHRVGWPNTGSWKIFYRLDELRRGDRLTVTSRKGKTFRYEVRKKLVVSPQDVWVTERVKGRDLLTLQTCTGPNFSKRLIIRADRV